LPAALGGTSALLPGRRFQRPHSARAFSLVELMAAVTVLAILSGMVFQIISSSSKATKGSMNKLDSLEQARLVLDRLGLDLAAAVRRKDLPFEYDKNAAGDSNDELRFYAHTLAYGAPERRVSALSYVVQPAAGSLGGRKQLQRAGFGMDWSGVASPGFSGSFPTPAPTGYQTLGSDIFRFEICFFRKNTAAGLAGLVSTPPSDLSDISALLIGVAVVDAEASKILDAGDINSLVNALKDPPDGVSPEEQWTADLQNLIQSSSLPKRALQGIRIFQRTYDTP
jgi:prepilin-type N-terminal cleavage/methylation domain-containing protein